MDLKELKKLADALDDSGKRELIHFLQSRTKGMSAPIGVKSRNKCINMGMPAPIATIVLLCDLANMLLKHALEKSNGNVTTVNPAFKHSMT